MRIDTLLVLPAFVLLFHPSSLQPAEPSVDDLLQLKEAQAESMQTMEADIESQVEMNGRTSTSRVHMALDKARGAMRMQHLDAKTGEVKSDMMVDGNKVYYKSAGGKWIKLPEPDAQTKATLESMGVALGANSKTLAGGEALSPEEKALNITERETLKGYHLRLARQAVGAPLPAAASVSGTVATDNMEMTQLTPRLKKALEARQARIKRKIAKMKQRMEIEREPESDRPEINCLALRHRPKDPGHHPWDEELVHIDKNNGMAMERVRYMLAERYPGGEKKIPAKAVHRKSKEGKDLVEISRVKVNKTTKIKDIDMPEESESHHFTVAGTVTRKTKWKQMKVDEGVEKGMFSRGD